MKKVIALSLLTAALFAGKDVIPATAEPVAVNPAPPANENLSSHSISLKLGTLGVGLDAEHMFSPKFGARLNINGLVIKKSKTIKDIPFNLEADLFTAGLLADYHPWESSFRLTAGAYYNGNKFKGDSETINKTITIGDNTYDLGTINVYTRINYNKFAPYLGFGWSSAENSGWHLNADIGVMYIGKPSVKLTGHASNADVDKQLQQDLPKKQKEIYDKIKKYKFYPVVMIGIQKKF